MALLLEKHGISAFICYDMDHTFKSDTWKKVRALSEVRRKGLEGA